MSTSSKQEKKIIRQSQVQDDGASNDLLSVENAIEEAIEESNEEICGEIKSVGEQIASIGETLKKKSEDELDYTLSDEDVEKLRGPKGDAYELKESDIVEIASKVKIPTVEIKTVVEKTTVTKEIPIVTEIVKEVAMHQTPEEIRDSLEGLVGDERLKYTAIDGLEELLKSKGAKEIRLIGGPGGIFMYVNGVKKGIMKTFNLKAGTGMTLVYTVVNGMPTITFNSSSSGTNVYGEVVTPVGTSATLAHAPTAGTLRLYLNGLRIKEGTSATNGDYSVSGATITFFFTPAGNQTVLADYSY